MAQSVSAEAVHAALGTVGDPCVLAAGLELSVVDLGLIGGVEVDGASGRVRVEITFTEVGCVFTHRVIANIEDALLAVPGVTHVEVMPRWAPAWTEARMNAKAAGIFAEARGRLIQLRRTGRADKH
jgi:metal-sulfur cluster biosynthetic enzyme